MSHSEYFPERDRKNEAKLEELLSSLPTYCRDFFRGISQSTTTMTRVSYAYDLTLFFRFLNDDDQNAFRRLRASTDPHNLSAITQQDVERYLEYLGGKNAEDGSGLCNEAQGSRRRLSSLKSFFGYFCRAHILSENPAAAAIMPKLREKEIIRLNQDEMKAFLQELNDGAGLTGKEKAYHDRFKRRDIAMLSLMLGTGIRVSECVGLDIGDIDFKENGAHIKRKGGKEAVVYFSDSVAENLQTYLIERNETSAEPGHENALFLSRQRCRISVRGVEYLVKKYALAVTPNKRITPHKLRSSYGTALYAKTKDIYLVGKILGHKNINVTARYYTDIEEKQKQSVQNIDLLN